jgi:nucleosome binding factor SPN SPT16 subunit
MSGATMRIDDLKITEDGSSHDRLMRVWKILDKSQLTKCSSASKKRRQTYLEQDLNCLLDHGKHISDGRYKDKFLRFIIPLMK